MYFPAESSYTRLVKVISLEAQKERGGKDSKPLRAIQRLKIAVREDKRDKDGRDPDDEQVSAISDWRQAEICSEPVLDDRGSLPSSDERGQKRRSGLLGGNDYTGLRNFEDGPQNLDDRGRRNFLKGKLLDKFITYSLKHIDRRGQTYEGRIGRNHNDRGGQIYDDGEVRNYDNSGGRNLDVRGGQNYDDRCGRNCDYGDGQKNNGNKDGRNHDNRSQQNYDDRGEQKFDDRIGQNNYDNRGGKIHDDRDGQKNYDDRHGQKNYDDRGGQKNYDDIGVRTHNERDGKKYDNRSRRNYNETAGQNYDESSGQNFNDRGGQDYRDVVWRNQYDRCASNYADRGGMNYDDRGGRYHNDTGGRSYSDKERSSSYDLDQDERGLKERMKIRFFQETHRYEENESELKTKCRKLLLRSSDDKKEERENIRCTGMQIGGNSNKRKSLLFLLLSLFSVIGCIQAAPVPNEGGQMTCRSDSVGSLQETGYFHWSRVDEANVHKRDITEQQSQTVFHKRDLAGVQPYLFEIVLAFAEILFWIILLTKQVTKEIENDPVRERLHEIIADRYSKLKFQYAVGQIGNCIFWFIATQQRNEFVDETAGSLVIAGVSFFSKFCIVFFKYSTNVIAQDQKTLKEKISVKEQDTKLSTYLAWNSTLNRVIPVAQGPVKQEFTDVSEINCEIEDIPLSIPAVRQNVDFGVLKRARPLHRDSCLDIKQSQAPLGEENVINSNHNSQRQESCIFIKEKKTSLASAKRLDNEGDGEPECSDNDSGFDSLDVDSVSIDEDVCYLPEHSYNEIEVKENSSFLFGKDGEENDSLYIELSKHEPFCGNSLPLPSANEVIDDARVPATEEIEEPILLERQIDQFMKSKKKENYRLKVVTTDELSLSQLRNDSRASLLEGIFHSLPVRESKATDKKKIDAVCHKKDFLKSVWGMYDELPVPKIEITVAFKEAAEVQVQYNPATQQAVNPNFEPLDVIIKKIADDESPGPQITMRYEMLRICTLRNYPKDNKPWLTQLAAAGFYYAAEGDEVICYCCGLRRHSWVSTDVPERIHQRINPNCKFLNRNSEFNVPIRYEGTTPNMEKIEALLNMLQEAEMPTAITNGAEGGSDVSEYVLPIPKGTKELQKPKHPQYISKQQRISSFDGWPDSLTQTPEIMAEAGFYYAGFGDCVRCYYCGIGLRHWTKEDNPWIEHARWSQHCAFVKMVKGQEFINLVQMAVQVTQNNENQESSSSSEPTGESSERNQREQDEVENILRTDPAQSVLEMGYQPRIIKKAIDFILKREGKSGISSLKIMEKVLEFEDAESARELVGELAHMHLNRQDSASGGPPSGGSVKSGELREAPARSSANTSKKNSKPKHSNHSGEIGRSNKDPNRPTAKDIKEENHRLKEQTLCKVCLDNTVCIVFLPCGHLCTCDDCAPAMRTCPICRKDVKGTVKTYMS